MRTTWPCCSHCPCVAQAGHAQPCGQVGCSASRSPVGQPAGARLSR